MGRRIHLDGNLTLGENIADGGGARPPPRAARRAPRAMAGSAGTGAVGSPTPPPPPYCCPYPCPYCTVPLLTTDSTPPPSSGLHMAYNAFLAESPDAAPAERRLFFLSYAQVCRGRKRI
jgi:hypothetical protein